MRCNGNKELDKFIELSKPVTQNGTVADYIPALASAKQEHLSVSIRYLDGEEMYAGDFVEAFTLQSISKVLSLLYVLEFYGEEVVFKHVGKEPTGDPFNSIVKLEEGPDTKPLNPMINAGALAVTSLFPGNGVTERWERFQQFLTPFFEKDKIEVDTEIQKSEFDTAFLNRSMIYYLKQNEIINDDVEELMTLYTRQCSVLADCLDIAKIGSILAMNEGASFVSRRSVQIAKTFMVTCGMYNASGEFAIEVGVPAKSGVSGGILAVVPGRCGVGIFGPALDKMGNSIGGLHLIKNLSKSYNWSIF
ncbi:glutaminase A [Mangrovibacillus cuniculi]|uniref:glutaminase A n=1 Tax=Mangrovibacillus cuniculi TaxID=2593652 RepID=UPI001EFA1262|nr:glutaminase A [Mangrovibacillus cuniculi]